VDRVDDFLGQYRSESSGFWRKLNELWLQLKDEINREHRGAIIPAGN
jgi:hypothetical protein